MATNPTPTTSTSSLPISVQPLDFSSLNSLALSLTNMFGQQIQNAGSGIASTLANPLGALTGGLTTNLFAGFSWSRVIIVILGVILIGAGLFLFKPVGDTIISTGKLAGKLAA